MRATTKRDPDGALTFYAFMMMDQKRELWERWQLLHEAQCSVFGAHTAFYSGIGRSKAPRESASTLRWLAAMQARASDQAYDHWRRAGRRAETLRRLVHGTGERFAWTYC